MIKSKGITFVRLYFQKFHRHYKTTTSLNSVLLKKNEDTTANEKIEEPNKAIVDEVRDKILYNSLLESLKSEYGTRRNFYMFMEKIREKSTIERRTQKKNPIPLTLKYYTQDESVLSDLRDMDARTNERIAREAREGKGGGVTSDGGGVGVFPFAREQSVSVDEQWMGNYETYRGDDVILEEVSDEDVLEYKRKKLAERDETEVEEEDLTEKTAWRRKYGTPDPKAKVSDVPCGGCGAMLHCSDPSIPGYLPSEIYKHCSQRELTRLQCQRCHFLREYNLALGINVRPQDYERMLHNIRPEKALIILMVDLLDFPCSIWPGILDIVGSNKPVVVVGNKVDLIPQTKNGYLKHMENILRQTIQDSNLGKANIRHVSLISAKTGWGVEELITKLNKLWKDKGNVYIIGTTNVGKSTLFNILLQSDYCRVSAADLIQRATVSPWPGTTLNMLKFPIYRMSGMVLHLRHKRLIERQNNNRMELNLKHSLIKSGQEDSTNVMLISNVERTLPNLKNATESGDPFNYNMSSGFKTSGPEMGIDSFSDKFRNSRWCYDTPGVVHSDQIITVLTVEELLCTLPKELIRPRTFYMRENYSLFIGGIGRIDVLKVYRALRLNVFASNRLPITVCKTEHADLLYSKLLGTEYFVVPVGDKERLSKWPPLATYSKTIEMDGQGWKDSVGDVVLSSCGWVSVNAADGETVRLSAWIVGGRGIHVRKTSLVDGACQLKGSRIDGTPAYGLGEHFVKINL